MPFIEPVTSERNFTPISTGLGSFTDAIDGVAVSLQIRAPAADVAVPGTTVTVVEPPAPSRLPLSSTAALRIVTVPSARGAHAKLQLSRPVAGCQVAPPSTETSTPPTTPPPASAAVPEIRTVEPAWTVPPGTGSTREAGGVRSVEAGAGASGACSVPGCAPMSASRLTVACWMRGSGGPTGAPALLSWWASRPHDHCVVPAPNTSAPLGAL